MGVSGSKGDPHLVQATNAWCANRSNNVEKLTSMRCHGVLSALADPETRFTGLHTRVSETLRWIAMKRNPFLLTDQGVSCRLPRSGVAAFIQRIPLLAHGVRRWRYLQHGDREADLADFRLPVVVRRSDDRMDRDALVYSLWKTVSIEASVDRVVDLESLEGFHMAHECGVVPP